MALASSAEVQDALYPDFAAKGDELVNDYDDALSEVKNQFTLTTSQIHALEKLNTYLDIHSGSNYAEMYLSTTALYSDARWVEIRALAKELIESMGWQYEPPTKNQATYINENGVIKNT